MAEEGTLSSDSVTDIGIPEGVVQALGRRLDRLTPEANELLAVAAVVGREFTYDLLRQVREHSDEVLLGLIEEGLDALVIEELDVAGRYRFTHALMQETLLSELSTTRTVRLHGVIGEALEAQFGNDATRATELASHFIESSTLSRVHAGRAARYSETAGMEAQSAAAWDEAIRHYENCVAHIAEADDDVRAREATILARLVECMIPAASVSPAAWGYLERAYRLYLDAGDVAGATELLIAQGTSTSFLRREQGALFEEAGRLPALSTATRAQLAAGLAHSLGFQGDYESAHERFAEATAIAGEDAPPDVLLFIARREASVDLFHRRGDQPLHVANVRAAELAEQLDRPASAALSRYLASGALYRSANLEAALEQAERAQELASQARNRPMVSNGAIAAGRVHFARGDWGAARQAVNVGVEASPNDPRILAVGAWVESETGQRGSAKEFLDRIVERIAAEPPDQMPAAKMWGSGAAALAARAFDEPEFLELAESAGQAALEAPTITPAYRVGAVSALVQSACLRDDKEAAAILLESPDLGPSNSSPSVAFQRGLLASTLGRSDDAIDFLEEALAELTPFRVHHAWAAYECARARVVRGAQADVSRAKELAEDTLVVTTELGMRPLMERVLALRLELQGVTSDSDVTTSIDAVATSIAREQPDLASHAAPDGTVTILFSDIEGSTALNARLGDANWMELLHEHNAILRREIANHSGFEVKTEGDGFMIAFGSSRDGLNFAIAAQQALTERNTDAETTIRVRIGLHVGEVVKEGEDFYGRHVAMASRVASQASGGEVLVSSLLRELVEPSGEFAFESREPVALKGLDGDHVLHAVGWR